MSTLWQKFYSIIPCECTLDVNVDVYFSAASATWESNYLFGPLNRYTSSHVALVTSNVHPIRDKDKWALLKSTKTRVTYIKVALIIIVNTHRDDIHRLGKIKYVPTSLRSTLQSMYTQQYMRTTLANVITAHVHNTVVTLIENFSDLFALQKIQKKKMGRKSWQCPSI